jgi:hypothetical protein
LLRCLTDAGADLALDVETIQQFDRQFVPLIRVPQRFPGSSLDLCIPSDLLAISRGTHVAGF